MKIVANGVELHCLLEGPEAAPVVTFGNSLATDLHLWDAQADALRDRYRVLRYDTRGHGRSAAPPGPYGLRELAGDAIALLDALDIERTHFVGLSLGGMVGQVLGLERPDRLRSLALCDTTSRVPAEARAVWRERIAAVLQGGLEPLVEPTVERWLGPGFRRERPDAAERVRRMIRGTSPEGYAGCCHAIAELDLTDRLPGLRVPTLVVVGEDDPGTPVAAAQSLQRAIPGAELAVLPGARHLSNVEQAEAFNRALVDFLARH